MYRRSECTEEVDVALEGNFQRKLIDILNLQKTTP